MRGNQRAERLSARLRLTDTDGAIKEIVEAINKAGGSVQGAADELGIARRTLFMWASEYDAISNALKKARRKKAKETT
jgi:transposase-like protein